MAQSSTSAVRNEAPVIDRAHLDRMTGGDAELALEVLHLFDSHADLLMERMRGSEPKAVPMLAHALKGAALSIGAGAVAEAAAALEREPGETGALLRLGAAVEAARAAIAAMLAPPPE
jgi:HPt (histidine-containing phosphotransfer) domain-containing protein